MLGPTLMHTYTHTKLPRHLHVFPHSCTGIVLHREQKIGIYIVENSKTMLFTLSLVTKNIVRPENNVHVT
jgi:hypothetical protein